MSSTLRRWHTPNSEISRETVATGASKHRARRVVSDVQCRRAFTNSSLPPSKFTPVATCGDEPPVLAASKPALRTADVELFQLPTPCQGACQHLGGCLAEQRFAQVEAPQLAHGSER